MSRAVLIARPNLPAALDTMREAAVWLDAHGCAPAIEAASAAAAGLVGQWPVVERDTLADATDVVIAFGGDGTLLDAARTVAHGAADVPLMGVNLGRLGFLTAVGPADMTAGFEDLLAGRTRVEERLLLAGVVVRGGVRSQARLALNDLVVTRGALSRMIELRVKVDGEVVSHVKADGLIVATATGSTAYNLSAGGPIVHPSLDAIVLTPIAPHTLTNRPVVLSASSQVELHPIVEPRSDLLVTMDGQLGVPLEAGDVVEITRASRVLRLLHLASRTHFDLLREKLKWGNS